MKSKILVALLACLTFITITLNSVAITSASEEECIYYYHVTAINNSGIPLEIFVYLQFEVEGDPDPFEHGEYIFVNHTDFGEVEINYTSTLPFIGRSYRGASYPNVMVTEEVFNNSCGVYPTPQPTSSPTAQPTSEPTAQPTGEPTAQPTGEPTAQPTGEPTETPDDNGEVDEPEVSDSPSSESTEFNSIGSVIHSLRWGGLEYGFVIVNYSNPLEDALELSPSFLATLPQSPAQNTEFATSDDGLTRFYVLTTGEYQVNFGPDFEGKVHVVIFDRSFNVVKTYTFQ